MNGESVGQKGAHTLSLKTSSSERKMKMMGSSTKRRVSAAGRGGLAGVLREQRAKIYIIRRCVVMLLCWHD
ncbi:hypothetical protein MLD38_007496 [Melastoma candidum]|uniref:Uncharacterized protein n=2 Tax=Melastoma candidum TaxID=119954 RepID=A0ACB9RRU5_9MYRT|nr:hypothetical protein MLD38_007496 [Melastoma candidum]